MAVRKKKVEVEEAKEQKEPTRSKPLRNRGYVVVMLQLRQRPMLATMTIFSTRQNAGNYITNVCSSAGHRRHVVCYIEWEA